MPSNQTDIISYKKMPWTGILEYIIIIYFGFAALGVFVAGVAGVCSWCCTSCVFNDFLISITKCSCKAKARK
jgi:hypothetical protein